MTADKQVGRFCHSLSTGFVRIILKKQTLRRCPFQPAGRRFATSVRPRNGLPESGNAFPKARKVPFRGAGSGFPHDRRAPTAVGKGRFGTTVRHLWQSGRRTAAQQKLADCHNLLITNHLQYCRKTGVFAANRSRRTEEGHSHEPVCPHLLLSYTNTATPLRHWLYSKKAKCFGCRSRIYIKEHGPNGLHHHTSRT